MPVLRHAKKKLRQDKKRTEVNRGFKEFFRGLVKKAQKSPTAESVSAAFQAVDKAAKKNLIHKNKAAHMKSSLSKALAGVSSTKTVAPKTAAKKTEKAKTATKKAAAKKPATKTAKKTTPKKK